MGLSEFTIRLIILLLPGIIGTLIAEKLIIHKPWSQFKFLINVLIISIFSYLVLQLLSNLNSRLLCEIPKLLDFWVYLENGKSIGIPYTEIIYSTMVSIFLAFVASASSRYGWINRLGQLLRVTNKYGSESVYYRVLNSKDVEWVYLRVPETNLTYRGQVTKYSEDEKNRELVLYRVTVYEYKTSKELYYTDEIYLCFPIDYKLIIEIPN